DGQPMNAKKWSEHNWRGPLEELKIRHRKFYATRHTFLTEKIRQGENPFALAQYAGTSVAMLEKDYVGTLGLSTLHSQQGDREVFEKYAKNPNEIMVAGPGFEPGIDSALKSSQVLSMRKFKQPPKRKSAYRLASANSNQTKIKPFSNNYSEP